jgi:hypothetical protein
MSTIRDAMEHRRQERATEGNVVQMPATGNADLVFREDAAPPFDKFLALLEDRPAKQAWEHKLKDLPDQEVSTYDALLARCAVNAGWGDQETVNLLLAHRKQHHEDPRLNGAYYLDLLKRTKEEPGGATPAGAGRSSDPAVSELIAKLNRALRIRIEKITKFGGNDGTYELTLEDGRKVDLGPAVNVLNHRLTKAAIASATTEVIPPCKQAEWDRFAGYIFKAAGLAPVEQASEQQELWWWLRTCVSNATVQDLQESDKAGLTRVIRERAGLWAFRNERGELLISLGGFIKAIPINCGARPTWKDICLRLRKAGFRPRDLEGRSDDDGKARLNVWQSPGRWEADV